MDSGTFENRHLICTVIAPNYLSQALTLGESIAKVMPEVDFRILVLQDCENTDFIDRGIEKYVTVVAGNRHKAESVADIDWQDFDLALAANQYELLELATSVKPALLRNYLLQGWGRVTYLDPDIQVFNNFENILDDNVAISLTPHILKDFPNDGKQPNQNVILSCGIFNLGFISVRPSALDFLQWWSGKLQNYCTIDTKQGYFVDQRWMDWSMNLSNPQVIRDPGMNVSYWNLHERAVCESNASYVVKVLGNDHPLYFYHYSGLDVGDLSRLSKYSDRVFSQDVLPVSILESYARARQSWKEYSPNPAWSIAGRMHGASLPEKWRFSMLSQSRKEGGEGVALRDFLENSKSSVENSVPPYISTGCRTCGSCGQPLKRKSVENLAQWFQGRIHREEITRLGSIGYASDVSEYLEKVISIRTSGTTSSRLLRSSLRQTLRLWKLLPMSLRTNIRPLAIRLYRRFF
jgi:hypothetical protein